MTAPTPARGASPSRAGRDSKDALRASARAARAARTDLAAADQARLPRLLEACAGHRPVACYTSISPEPDTLALIAALSDAGVPVLLPKLAGRRTPGWAWFTGEDALVPGWHGIPEPDGPTLGPQALAECSFVWASALLVTPGGHRLGTGGGWYDRALLHRAPDARLGVLVHDGEVVPELPVDPWDVPVDVVVTPTRTLLTGARPE